MKNQHLIPINVIDIVEKINTTKLNSERQYLIQRLEAIRDYCDHELNRANRPEKNIVHSKYGKRNV